MKSLLAEAQAALDDAEEAMLADEKFIETDPDNAITILHDASVDTQPKS